MTQKHTLYKLMASASVLPVLAVGAAASAEEGLQVTKVENINTTQFVVYFNEPVELEKMTKSTELQKYFKLETADGKQTISLKRGELSKDGRSYQLTTSTPVSVTRDYRVRVFSIYSQHGEKLTTYNEVVHFAKDQTPPAIQSVEWVNKNQSRVIFTEPVKNYTAKFKLENGKAVTGIRTAVDGNVLTYYLATASAGGRLLPEGSKIIVTYNGVRDLANNLARPSLLTATLTKGESTNANLLVTSVEQVGIKKFKITFNHPLFFLYPSDLAVSAGKKKLTVQNVEDIDDNSYIVTVNEALEGQITISTAPDSYVTDMETWEDTTFSVKHDFDAAAAGLKIVQTEVIRENNLEYLFITFNNNVNVNSHTAASYTGFYTEPKSQRKKPVEDKQVKVRAVYNQPNKVKIPLRELLHPHDVEQAAYEMDLAFTNLSYGSMDGGTVSFQRSKDYSFNGEKLEVVAVNTSLTDPNITDPRYITIDFNQPVEESVASELDNYEVRGYKLGEVQVNPENPKQVILRIESRSYWWYLTPYLYITDLRAAGSYEEISDYYEPISLPAVVAPQESYWNPSLSAKHARELVLSFGQAVSISNENDFIVTDKDGTSYGAKATVDPLNPKNVILTLSKSLPNYSTITVKLKDGKVIRDIYQNPGTFEAKSIYISTLPWYSY